MQASPFLWRRFLWRFHSESDSDGGGSIWSRGVSAPFPTHQIQAMPLLHSHHVDSCRSCQFAIFVRQQDRRMPRAREPRVLQNGKKYSESHRPMPVSF